MLSHFKECHPCMQKASLSGKVVQSGIFSVGLIGSNGETGMGERALT